jgi:hypothetical protein
MLGDKGDGEMVAFLPWEVDIDPAQDAPSAHFLEILMFRTGGFVFGNITLDIPWAS